MHRAEKLLLQATIGENKSHAIKYKDYQEAIEAAKPSAEPEFWAKKSCKHCYGRGIVGKTTTVIAGGNRIINEQICNCASKSWQAWQEAFVEQLKKAERKSTIVEPNEDQSRKIVSTVKIVSSDLKTSNGNKNTIDRLNRLDVVLKPLQRQLEKLEQQREELVQKDAVRTAEYDLLDRQQEKTELQQLAHMQEKQADQLEEEAKQYQAMAKEAYRQATALRQRTKSEVLSRINRADRAVEKAQQALDAVRRDLDKIDHKLGKKSRELQKKIDRLTIRRSRIVSETGLDPDFIPEMPISTDTPT